MPKASAHEIVSRQWEILKRLPARTPGLTCAELCAHLAANGHPVTKRTVERDLRDLGRAFSLVADAAPGAPAARWRWREGHKLDTGSLTNADALGLALSETAIRPLLPAGLLRTLQPRFELARAKLADLGDQAYARWLKKVRSVPASLQFHAPAVPAPLLATVQEALFEERQLEIDYSTPADRKARTLLVHPLGLVYRAPVTYLVASAFNFGEPRLYALHRMGRARRVNEARRVPPGFTLDGFLAAGHLDFAPGEELRLKARVGDALAGYLTETPLGADQKITGAPGRYQLTATVRDSWQLRFWILSQGPEITILQPASLRKVIVATLDETRTNYATR